MNTSKSHRIASLRLHHYWTPVQLLQLTALRTIDIGQVPGPCDSALVIGRGVVYVQGPPSRALGPARIPVPGDASGHGCHHPRCFSVRPAKTNHAQPARTSLHSM